MKYKCPNCNKQLDGETVEDCFNCQDMKTQDRTIRDVKEDNLIKSKHVNYWSPVLAVGKNGFCVEEPSGYITWFTWEEAENCEVKLKQPEKQEIEKLNIEATPTIAYAGFIIISNKLNEVIESHNELQKVVNKLLEK